MISIESAFSTTYQSEYVFQTRECASLILHRQLIMTKKHSTVSCRDWESNEEVICSSLEKRHSDWLSSDNRVYKMIWSDELRRVKLNDQWHKKVVKSTKVNKIRISHNFNWVYSELVLFHCNMSWHYRINLLIQREFRSSICSMNSHIESFFLKIKLYIRVLSKDSSMSHSCSKLSNIHVRLWRTRWKKWKSSYAR